MPYISGLTVPIVYAAKSFIEIFWGQVCNACNPKLYSQLRALARSLESERVTQCQACRRIHARHEPLHCKITSTVMSSDAICVREEKRRNHGKGRVPVSLHVVNLPAATLAYGGFLSNGMAAFRYIPCLTLVG